MGFIASVIRWTGIIAASIMVMSFILFATDSSGTATKGQVAKVEGRTQGAPVAGNSTNDTRYRKKLEEANAKLSQPFEWATKDISSDWGQRGLTMLLGVIVYGLGFAWPANLLPKPKMREPTPWHT